MPQTTRAKPEHAMGLAITSQQQLQRNIVRPNRNTRTVREYQRASSDDAAHSSTRQLYKSSTTQRLPMAKPTNAIVNMNEKDRTRIKRSTAGNGKDNQADETSQNPQSIVEIPTNNGLDDCDDVDRNIITIPRAQDNERQAGLGDGKLITGCNNQSSQESDILLNTVSNGSTRPVQPVHCGIPNWPRLPTVSTQAEEDYSFQATSAYTVAATHLESITQGTTSIGDKLAVTLGAGLSIEQLQAKGFTAATVDMRPPGNSDVPPSTFMEVSADLASSDLLVVQNQTSPPSTDGAASPKKRKRHGDIEYTASFAKKARCVK
ncbi:hypothetical protein NX059_010588 [Plenodomus lindquistii]|nr:hypothetical protein NX059_010588 [Plenodomus lindquistii]